MKKLLNALRVKSEPNQLLDLVVSLIEKQDWSSIQRIANGSYVAGDATVTVKYFDPDAFEEMQISFGYSVGKGVTIVLRNYVEHLIVINHEILGTYRTIEFPVGTGAFALKDYRDKMDAIAVKIIAAVRALSSD